MCLSCLSAMGGAADYVPRSCISVIVNNIPKAFMVRFVEEASEASRSTEHEPRALGHFNSFFVFFLLFFPNWHEQDTRRQPDSLGAPSWHAKDTRTQPGILGAPSWHAQDTVRQPDSLGAPN